MTILIKKVQTEIIMALVLILLGAGVEHTVSNNSDQIVIDSDYNPYSAKVQEVDLLMQDVLTDKANLDDVQDSLFYDYAPWANRQRGAEKEVFLDYLEACNQIIIQKSKGLNVDTSEMEKLKNELI